jgi:hypothetical protein
MSKKILFAQFKKACQLGSALTQLLNKDAIACPIQDHHCDQQTAGHSS